MVVVTLYLGGCVLIWLRHLQQRPQQASSSSQWLISYASQTGVAEQLAQQSAKPLQAAGLSTSLMPLNQLTSARMATTERLLLVVSTYGDGEPPDNAALFAHRMLGQTLELTHLQYGLLALGDRQYPHFCEFGHRVNDWLQAQGATALFDPIEVDAGDPDALRRWQQQVGQLSGTVDASVWDEADDQPWCLVERRWLNPGSPSPGGPIYHLILEPASGAVLPNWQAGDIAEVQPGNSPEVVARWLESLGHQGWDDALFDALIQRQLPDPAQHAALRALHLDALPAALPRLPRREYSIASLPASGRLELVVRQMFHPDGQLGLGSGWLTHHAQASGLVTLRIRSNPSFHGPLPEQPLVLIGNGTGIAGLRAHLLARETTPGTRNWLLFGERSSAHDRLFDDELHHWLATGHLQYLDRTFSRDQEERIYVQHRLLAAASRLQAWVADGAAIYVCGSLDGMARDVDAALNRILGSTTLQRLTQENRYRRDVY